MSKVHDKHHDKQICLFERRLNKVLSKDVLKKIYTENPFIDSLLYLTKLLAYDTVVKIEDMADQYETAQSARDGDIYIACLEGHESFVLFDYTMEDYWNVGITDYNTRLNYVRDKSKVPTQYRDELTQIGKERFLSTYEEGNNYYRMICGLPDLNDSGIPVKLYEYMIPPGNEYSGEYIHQLGYKTCRMLEKYGILDAIKEDYPEAKYLNFVTYGITPYKARKAFNFQLLYKPDIGNPELEDLFEQKFNENRNYLVQTMRTEAMKLRSQYYDHFMAIMMIMMTITDVINETAEHLVKKDILDMRCCKYIFEMYGVPYYNEIPLMYQQRMAKAIHALVKDKSCLRCMEAFIDIFGCGDIQLFKWYILRDRLPDQIANEYAYTEMIETILNENDVIACDEKTIDTTQLEADVEHANIYIPFPFKRFLERGNLLHVFIGENKERLVFGEDYEIVNGNQFYLLNQDHLGETLITFKFYWDIRTESQDNVPNTKESFQLYFRTYNYVSKPEVPYELPPGAIFNPSKTDLLILVDGAIINNNLYSISEDQTKIVFDESLDIGVGSRRNVQISVGYFHSVKFTPCYKKVAVEATVEDQNIFFIPEPFPKYMEYENAFFISLGDVLIENSRYTISKDADDKYIVTLTDMTLDPGRNLYFHFLYNAKGVYVPLELYETETTITATTDDQVLFDLDFPVEHYVERGYRVYVKYNDWFLSDTYFNIFTNKLQFTTQILSIDKDDELQVYFKYSSAEENVTVLHDYVATRQKNQKKFTINYPMDPYYDGNNLIILDYEGWPLEEGVDFHWTNTNKTELQLDNENLLVLIGLRLHITYIFNEVYTRDKFTIQYKRLIATVDGQRDFRFKFPFYPYRETGQNLLVIYKTKAFPETEYEISTYDIRPRQLSADGYKESKLMFKTLNTIKEGEEILLVMFYNNRYALSTEGNFTVKEVSKEVDEGQIDGRYYTQEMPLPYPDYVEKGWPLYIMCDANNRLVPEEDYELIEGKLTMDPEKALYNYGDKFTYVFIYKDEEPWVQTDLKHEDIISDIDLHFVRIPMDDERPLENLKQRYLFRKYDIVTLQDPFWDGEENDSYHSVLRNIIKERPWNYSRTKYIGVSFLYDASEAMLQVAYFQSMWYDKWKYEEELTLELPNLSPNHAFRWSDTFTFLTILTHIFTGYTDALLDTRTKVLWVRYQQGFNFDADMEVIRRWMREDFYKHDYEYPDVFGFAFEDDPEFDIEDLLEVYRTNSDLCKLILHRMANAWDYDEYCIWKRFYESLMLHEENMDYFKLEDGTIPATFTEHLKTRDDVLYQKVKEISEIGDVESQQNTIINTVNDVLFFMQQYMDADEFKGIFNQYPGVSGEYIAQYLYLMINFFKSYKVEWIPGGMGDKLMQIGDPDRNFVRPIDVFDYDIHYDIDEYVAITEVHDDNIHFSEEDHVNIKEMIQLKVDWGKTIPIEISFEFEIEP